METLALLGIIIAVIFIIYIVLPSIMSILGVIIEFIVSLLHVGWRIILIIAIFLFFIWIGSSIFG